MGGVGKLRCPGQTQLSWGLRVILSPPLQATNYCSAEFTCEIHTAKGKQNPALLELIFPQGRENWHNPACPAYPEVPKMIISSTSLIFWRRKSGG